MSFFTCDQCDIHEKFSNVHRVIYPAGTEFLFCSEKCIQDFFKRKEV